MSFQFCHDAEPDCIPQIIIGSAAPQYIPDVGFLIVEETGPQLAFGGQAQPVATLAEMMTYGTDKPNASLLTRPVGQAKNPCRSL